MRMIAEGSDSLASFEVLIPGTCKACNKGVEVAILYNPSGLAAALKRLGIEVSKTRSLIVYDFKNSRREIGVTCGCYARFHRQVAHIGDKRSQKDRG